MTNKLHGKNIIAGELRDGGTEGARAVNPATGEQLEPEFIHATESEVQQAAEQAERAQEEFLRLGSAPRAGLLRRMADEILALGDPLIERCHLETALPEGRLVSERSRTANQLRLFADLLEEGSWVDARIDTAIPNRTPTPRPDLRRMLIPLGPVAVFCASNFPLAFSVAGGDTASALAAGCPVIVKAHGSHPGTAELVATAVNRAIAAEKMPPGIFSLLHGPGKSDSNFYSRSKAGDAADFVDIGRSSRATPYIHGLHDRNPIEIVLTHQSTQALGQEGVFLKQPIGSEGRNTPPRSRKGDR